MKINNGKLKNSIQGNPYNPISLFFSRKSAGQKVRRHDIFKMMKGGKNLQPRLHYPASISFRFDKEIQSL